MTATRKIGRRRQAAASLTRTILSTVVLLVIYYQAPLDRPGDPRIFGWLAAGVFALGAAIAWQARVIAVSSIPRLRAVETAALAVAALLILYSSAYVVMSNDQPDSFTEVLGRTDALYYTMTIFATVGFGDITPTAESTRIVTMTQMVVGILAVGLAAKLLVGAVGDAVARKAALERTSDATVDATAPGDQAE
jgi:hypothetical protein